MGYDTLDPATLAQSSYYLSPTTSSTATPTTTTTTSSLSSYYSSEAQPFRPMAPVAPPPAPPPPPTFMNANGLKLKNMDAHCVGEDKDASMIRGSASNWQGRINAENSASPTLTSVTTHYMNDAERSATSVSARDGKLVNANGQLVDTTDASGIGTFNKEGAQKHIFTMDGDKGIRTADPWAEKKVTTKEGGGANLGFINHSSFTGGKAVAGAGEMRVEKGELQQVSDQSGHYKPDGEMVGQTLDQLGAMGVNMDKTSLKLTGKGPGQNPLYVSPTQFQQHDAANAESEIRAEKTALHGQLLNAVGTRKARLGLADSEGDAPIAPVSAPAMPHAYRNAMPDASGYIDIDSLPVPASGYIDIDSLPAPASGYIDIDSLPAPASSSGYIDIDSLPAPIAPASAGYIDIDSLPAPAAYKNVESSLYD